MESFVEKDQSPFSYEYFWLFLLKVKVSGEDVVVFLITTSEADILKEVCETAPNNLKTCYTIDKVDDDIRSMVLSYVYSQLLNKVNAYEEE